MQRILLLALMIVFTNTALAGSDCSDVSGESSKTHPATCVVVKNTDLECNDSPSSDYLSHCIAEVAYQAFNHSNDDTEAKISCNVEIKYLKSVMGIRDISRERNSQIHNLSANSKDSFAMTVEFKFATQTEASNAEIKAAHCQIDASAQ